MPAIDIKPKAKKFIETLPPKHQRQIKESILSLQQEPLPQDAKKLMGYENYTRIDIGEYRIVYRFEENDDLITVVLAGKRNDNDIYRVAKRTLK
ncbi:MAG: type II toxin-antitoxin system RelE/ParE family toxin [Legionellales bacterium]|nr:type II toxin-antitoxin system RelE/ParE family toxin [Legionellales bacterium]